MSDFYILQVIQHQSNFWRNGSRDDLTQQNHIILHLQSHQQYGLQFVSNFGSNQGKGDGLMKNDLS